jgi:hypothetical protein
MGTRVNLFKGGLEGRMEGPSFLETRGGGTYGFLRCETREMEMEMEVEVTPSS